MQWPVAQYTSAGNREALQDSNVEAGYKVTHLFSQKLVFVNAYKLLLESTGLPECFAMLALAQTCVGIHSWDMVATW